MLVVLWVLVGVATTARTMTTGDYGYSSSSDLTARDSVMAGATKKTPRPIGVPSLSDATAITGGKIFARGRLFQTKKEGQPDLLLPSSSYLLYEKTTSGTAAPLRSPRPPTTTSEVIALRHRLSRNRQSSTIELRPFSAEIALWASLPSSFQQSRSLVIDP